jgi:hypothetical protein
LAPPTLRRLTIVGFQQSNIKHVRKTKSLIFEKRFTIFRFSKIKKVFSVNAPFVST